LSQGFHQRWTVTGAKGDGSCFHEIKRLFKLPDPTGGLDGATASGELA